MKKCTAVTFQGERLNGVQYRCMFEHFDLEVWDKLLHYVSLLSWMTEGMNQCRPTGHENIFLLAYRV